MLVYVFLAAWLRSAHRRQREREKEQLVEHSLLHQATDVGEEAVCVWRTVLPPVCLSHHLVSHRRRRCC